MKEVRTQIDVAGALNSIVHTLYVNDSTSKQLHGSRAMKNKYGISV